MLVPCAGCFLFKMYYFFHAFACMRVISLPRHVSAIHLLIIQYTTAGKPVTQESSLDVFSHVIFDVNIDMMDVRGRTQEFVAL